jgi:hypothetical protein
MTAAPDVGLAPRLGLTEVVKPVLTIGPSDV